MPSLALFYACPLRVAFVPAPSHTNARQAKNGQHVFRLQMYLHPEVRWRTRSPSNAPWLPYTQPKVGLSQHVIHRHTPDPHRL